MATTSTNRAIVQLPATVSGSHPLKWKEEQAKSQSEEYGRGQDYDKGILVVLKTRMPRFIATHQV
jgi:hypothetical protein